MAFSPETYALLKGQGGGGGSGLPSVTEADNGKVLSVVNGAWAASNKVIIATINNGVLSLSFRQIYEYINSGYLIYLENQDMNEYYRYPLTQLEGEEGDSLFVNFGPAVFSSQDLDEPMILD